MDELSRGIHKIQMFELFGGHTEMEDQESTFKKIMKSCDSNGDGRIDYAEFIQATIHHKSLMNDETIKSAFSMFDLNGDGQISRDELKQMFSEKVIGENSDLGNDMIDEIMNEVDKNNDDNINHEEFNAALTQILTRTAKR